MKRIEKDPMLSGVIASAAWLVKAHGVDSMATELLMDYVGPVEQIKKHGEEYDLAILRKLFPEIKRKMTHRTLDLSK